MYMLTRAVPLCSLLAVRLPCLAAAFVIAEVFYKFHSFTLECLAFLATWYVLDAAGYGIERLIARRAGSNPAA